MRSPTVLGGLGLLASLGAVAASKCRPQPPSASWPDPSATTLIDPISSTGEQDWSSTFDPGPDSSVQTSPAATTSAPAVRVVLNSIQNGNFEGYDPNWPGGIHGFNSTGRVRLVQGIGYKGDGSQDSSCVEMSAGPGAQKKRQAEYNSIIEQFLTNLDVSTSYTVRLYYSIAYSTADGACRLDAYYGDSLFDSTPAFPVVENTSPWNGQWLEFLSEAPVESTEGWIKFELSCTDGASAQVFIDQVFVSNQVSPDNMNNVSLIYTLQPATPTPTPTPTPSAEPTEPSTTEPLTESEIISESESPSATESSPESTPSPTDPSPSFTGKTCVSLLPQASSIPGRTCAKHIYTYSGGYRSIQQDDISELQCGAACLADPLCQSFVWGTNGNGCANYCALQTFGVAAGASNGGSTSPITYDRSCIVRTECDAQPDDTVCIDRAGSSTSGACDRVMGVAKSCVEPVHAVTLPILCGTGQCRDLCAQYPSCRSYAVGYGAWLDCKLYSAPVSDVVEANPRGSIFTDIECAECTDSTFSFSYKPVLADPEDMPVIDCPIPSSIPVSSEEPTLSASDSEIITPTPSLEPTSTLTPTTTTTKYCPSGISGNGACFFATPTPSGSMCWARGYANWIDAYGVDPREYPQQNSLMDCALLCKLDAPHCKAYTWNPDRGGSCMLSPEMMVDTGFVADASSPLEWNDMGCATCLLCSDTPPETASNSIPASIVTPTPVPSPTCGALAGDGCPMKSPLPIDAYCDMKVDLWIDAWAYPRSTHPYQDSAEQCAAICAGIGFCNAAGYNSDTNSCEFVAGWIGGIGFTENDDASTTWSDLHCFSCPSCEDLEETLSMGPPTPSSASWTPVAEESTMVPPQPSSISPPSTTTIPEDPIETSCSVPTPRLSEEVLCGMPGAAGNQAQSAALRNYRIEPVGSLAACALVCLQHAECASFGYVSSSTVCYPFTWGTAELGLTYGPGSSMRFYDAGCFSC